MPNFDYEKYMGRTMDIPNRMLEMKGPQTVEDMYRSGYAEPIPPAMTTHEEAMRLYPDKMPVGDMPRGFYESGDVYNTPDMPRGRRMLDMGRDMDMGREMDRQGGMGSVMDNDTIYKEDIEAIFPSPQHGWQSPLDQEMGMSFPDMRTIDQQSGMLSPHGHEGENENAWEVQTKRASR